RQAVPAHIKQMRNNKPRIPTPSAHFTAWMLGRPTDKLKEGQPTYVAKLCEICPEIKIAYEISQRFNNMVRERDANQLDSWLDSAEKSDLPELSNFAEGLKREKESIIAAITLKWSNAQCEGQVNRLKLIKRQMFGRAKIDLLKQRVI